MREEDFETDDGCIPEEFALSPEESEDLKAFETAFGPDSAFRGRIINNEEPMQRENERPGTPLEKTFRCLPEAGGCGQSKPVNEFFFEIKNLCSKCAAALSLRYRIPIEHVPMTSACRSTTSTLMREALMLATPAGRAAGDTAMQTNKGLVKGHDHFVREMVRGAIERPTDMAYFAELRDKFRKYIFDAYLINPSEYTNKPKNELLS